MSKGTTQPSRPYQGYPYLNPTVTDAPSLGPEQVEALSKWQNLPRKLLTQSLDHRVKNQPSQTTSKAPESSHRNPEVIREELQGNFAQISSRPTPSGHNPDRPVVYIDIPEGPSVISEGIPCKKTPASTVLDETPVVYIDIPENGGSEVSQSIEEQEPAYVQETILYDPFKDRRIELSQDTDSEDSNASRVSPGCSRREPPNTLNIQTPGSSGFGSAPSSLATHIPEFSSKETFIYRQSPDGFSLTPLPVNEYPAYPPPYEEIDTRSPGSNPVQSPEVPATEHPRVQVITPNSQQQQIIHDARRKVLTCQFCSATVQTLVVEENGFWTHVFAWLACLFFFPLLCYIYCFKMLRYKNHYCPSCNKKIGYQSPATCYSDSLTYISRVS